LAEAHQEKQEMQQRKSGQLTEREAESMMEELKRKRAAAGVS